MWATHQSLENLKHKALGMFFALPSKILSSPLSRISDQYNQNIEHISTSQLIWTQFCVFSQSFLYVHTQRYRLISFTEGLINQMFNLIALHRLFHWGDTRLTIIYTVCHLFLFLFLFARQYLHFTRGFGFVSFVDYAHSERAVQELNGRELDSRIIRVEKARRASGYDKTPGRCKTYQFKMFHSWNTINHYFCYNWLLAVEILANSKSYSP